MSSNGDDAGCFFEAVVVWLLCPFGVSLYSASGPKGFESGIENYSVFLVL